MAKKLSMFLRAFLKAAPPEWRNSFLRKKLDIPADLPEGVHFKMASTQDELEQSFRILHDAYVEVGLMKPAPTGLRVSLYHSLPTSIVLTVQKDGVVLGTLTVIRDSPLGLPSDKVLDLNKLRKPGIQIAEISALAIKPEWRGKLFFPLLKYLYEICVDVLRLDIVVMSAHSEWYFFYEALLSFQRIEDRVVDNYAFANFMPVVGEYANLKEGYFALARNYAHQPNNKNIFWYFTQHRIASFDKNKKRFYSITSPAMNLQTLDYFFNQKTNIFQNLSASEYWVIRNAYQGIDIASILKKPESFNLDEPQTRRSFQRLSACLSGVVIDRFGNQAPITVVEVSKEGLKAFLNKEENKIGEIVKAKIHIGEYDVPEINIRTSWHNQNTYGFQLTQVNQVWNAYIQFCESQDQTQTQAQTQELVKKTA